MKHDWATLLQSALSTKPDSVPADYMTMRQLVVSLGTSETTLRRKMRVLEAQGLIARRMFRVAIGCGRVVNVPHWKIQSAPKSSST
jgi:DNA-binding HxlR family transcriptional regulator